MDNNMTKQEFNNSILKRGYSYCPSKLLSEEYDINYRYEVNRWSTRDFAEGIQLEMTDVKRALAQLRIDGVLS